VLQMLRELTARRFEYAPDDGAEWLDAAGQCAAS
jgi:hypothetical protein